MNGPLLSVVVAVPIGVLSATRPNTLADHVSMVGALLGQSVPNFFLAILLMLWFGVQLKWLPISGRGTFAHLILPGITLATFSLARNVRLTRSSLLEIMQQDFIRTARAKGLPPARIFLKHELRNAVLPVVTVLGPAIATITTGGFVVELVFAIPGLGRYFVQAVQQLDYTVIMGTTVFYGAFLVFMVLLVDIVYVFIDPRVRLE